MTLPQTKDAYLGLEDPTPEEWARWHEEMLAERSRAAPRTDLYADPETAWSDRTFRQLFLFMYDTSFFDRAYRTKAFLDEQRARFGRIDSVLLWHAYPRLGFDARTQFDFYRDMPGGLAGLRRDVSDVLHAEGIRVFVDYNPWDAGTYDELGDIALALDADGVMLDTMAGVPAELEAAVRTKKRGVVFAPELRPADADLARFRQSWAQWYELGDDEPSIYRHRWLVPRHRQLAIRRWDRDRRGDIGYSFFCGSGLLLWENVFGSWNPYSAADRRLIAETAAVLDRYEDVVVEGAWRPLVPTGIRGLDANVWTLGPRSITTLRNRTAEPLRVPFEGAAFWGDRTGAVTIEPHGVQAIVIDDAAAIEEARAHFDRLSAHAFAPQGDTRTPPRLVMPRRSRDKPARRHGDPRRRRLHDAHRARAPRVRLLSPRRARRRHVGLVLQGRHHPRHPHARGAIRDSAAPGDQRRVPRVRGCRRLPARGSRALSPAFAAHRSSTSRSRS